MMKMTGLFLLILLSFPSFALDCFDKAGRDYHIDPDLLRAIAFRESSNQQTAMNIVSPESYAVGYMQIHSQNFSHLATFGITPEKLYSDRCMNIYTGAYILAIYFKRLGVTWEAVGAYNAGFKKTKTQYQRRMKYAQEIYTLYSRIKEKNKQAAP